MKIAIVGSRSITCPIPEGIIPESTTEIFSGGAIGIDTSAREYALKHKIRITEVLPEYDLYGKSAPLKRNDWLIQLSDAVYVFWDGKSRGTKYVINKAKDEGKPVFVYVLKKDRFEKVD